MALIDEVKVFYPEDRLKSLTNPNDKQASTIDDTYLGKVCDQVEAAFKRKAQTAFVVTDDSHLQAALNGVWAYLHRYKGEGQKAAEKRFDEECAEIAKTGPRGRLIPKTASRYTPTRPDQGTTPPFDDGVFEGIIPDHIASED